MAGPCVPEFKFHHLLASNREPEYFYLEIQLERIAESSGSSNCPLVGGIFTFSVLCN